MSKIVRYLVGVVVVLGLASVKPGSVASAQTFDRKTIVSINQPVEIPGTVVLPPGKYIFRTPIETDRRIVQVLSADGKKVYATVLGIPDYVPTPPDKPMLTFYETGPGTPRTLRAWFYPGDPYGVEFVYPKGKAAQLAKGSGQPVMSADKVTTGITSEHPTADQMDELSHLTVTVVLPSGSEISLADAKSLASKPKP